MKKHLLILMCLFLSVSFALGQNKRISGVVNDEDGVPVIGATVSIVGTSNAMLTDLDGKFSLNNVASDAVLKVSYVGYVAQEIPVSGKTEFTISLVVDALQVEEVVVTGYGTTQSRSKVTNSIAKVDSELIENGVYSNAASALSGAVAGLRVSTTSGLPTSSPTITLRGGTNFDGSGNPLYIIDGQLRTSMNDINPNDIESIEVMKDAGATAIYGARASNGVILITTKTGKVGKASITAQARIGVNFSRSLYEFLGAEDYITLFRTAMANNTPTDMSSYLTAAQPYGTGNDVVNNPAATWNMMFLTDENKYLLDNGNGWQTMTDPVTGETLIYKESSASDYNILNPTYTQDYNLSMSGGNDRGTYYAGLGYYSADGSAIGSEYERLTFTFNGSYKINDFIKSTSNFSYNRADYQTLVATSEANYYARVLSVPPTLRWEDEEGNLLLGTSYGDGNQLYQSEEAFQRFNQTDKFTMAQSFEFQLFPTFKVTASANWYYSEGYYESFNKDYQTTATATNTTRSTSATFDRDFTETYNILLNYNESFGNHNVSLLGGFEYYNQSNYGFQASGYGAPTDDFADLGYTTSDENARTIDSWHSQYATASFFGRLNYDYDSKYLLSATLRYDGYSSLLGDNRWGLFPGASAGWVFSKEDFMGGLIPALNFGKVRLSYGVNGNATDLGAYELQGSYSSVSFNGSTGFLIGGLPNVALMWEQTTTIDGGIDLSFWQNRLNASLTIYDRLTSNKYADYTLPSTTGFSSVTSNNGEYRNFGIELELSGKILQKDDWNWDASFNIAYNKNTVVSLPYNGVENNRQGGTEIYTGNGDETVWVGGYQEGQEPGVLTVFVAEGIYTDESQIPGDLVITAGNAVSNTGVVGYGADAYNALSASAQSTAYKIQAGDVIWKDINGDGVIDDKDQVVIGNTTPRFTGGLNTTITWKDLSLYIRGDFAMDYWLYDYQTTWIMGSSQGSYNNIVEILDAWSETNPTGSLPRHSWADQLSSQNYTRNSTLFAYRGDYFCLREVALSYNLPKNWVEAISCQNIQFTLSAQNIGYLTEAEHISTPEEGGYVYSSATLPLTVVGGISVTF